VVPIPTYNRHKLSKAKMIYSSVNKMIEIELDGKKVDIATEGSMIMHAAEQGGDLHSPFLLSQES
jgi:hypothetical protein